MSGYQLLANAIIAQAADDYRTACLLSISTEDKRKQRDANRTIKSLERFFFSSWYQILTNVDGQYLLNRLRTEVFCPV